VPLGARAAVALMRVEQPAGAVYDEAAWGSPELAIGFEQPLAASKRWVLHLSSQLAVGLPLAEHGSEASQLEGRALALANAFEGFGEPELFTPGVVPLTPATSLDLRGDRLHFSARLKLPLLLRVGDASLPAEAGARTVGFTPVLDSSVRLRALEWLSVGVDSRLTWRAILPVDDGRGTLQPRVGGTLRLEPTEAWSVEASLHAPLAGPLGGSTLTFGLFGFARF